MNLQEKIYNSEAFASILFEKKVEEICQKNKWGTTHSAFYLDPISKKHREIDIVARQEWENKNKQISIHNFLVIECKSNSGYSVLLTGGPSNPLSNVSENKFWAGTENYNRHSKIKNILVEEDVSNDDIKIITKKFDELFFPSDVSRLRNYLPNLNKITEYNAFKETNTQQSRDIESSVVWKAFQSLNSCVEGFIQTKWEHVESNIIAAIDFRQDESITTSVIEALEFYLDHAMLVHPILVIDSPLLEIKNGKPSPLKAGRIVRLNMYGHCDSWIDIVNSKFIEEYIKTLSIFYTSFFRKRRMTRKK